jgi:hypothetical protein
MLHCWQLVMEATDVGIFVGCAVQCTCVNGQVTGGSAKACNAMPRRDASQARGLRMDRSFIAAASFAVHAHAHKYPHTRMCAQKQYMLLQNLCPLRFCTAHLQGVHAVPILSWGVECCASQDGEGPVIASSACGDGVRRAHLAGLAAAAQQQGGLLCLSGSNNC